jgi:hypothetical protein
MLTSRPLCYSQGVPDSNPKSSQGVPDSRPIEFVRIISWREGLSARKRGARLQYRWGFNVLRGCIK